MAEIGWQPWHPLRIMNDTTLESRLDFYRRWGELEKPYFKWQLEQFAPYIGRRIGDVGCGLGNFVGFFREQEIYVGFEPDGEFVREFMALHGGKNITLAAHGDICTDEAVEEMRSNGLDTILCINVLEHIEDDACALSKMVDGVSRNGHICIIVPAFAFLYGSLDRLGGHCRRYSKKSLRRLALNLDVEVVKCHYLNFLGGLGWFIKGRIIREKTHGNENYRIMNMLLPVVSFLERHIKPPFGLSVVMVLRKA